MNPIDLPVRWPRKAATRPSANPSATQPFQLLGRQILQLRKLGMAMGGGRSRVDRTPPAARSRLSGAAFQGRHFRALNQSFQGVATAFPARLSFSSRVPLAPRPHPEEPAKRASRRASLRGSPTGARWVCHASPVASLLDSFPAVAPLAHPHVSLTHALCAADEAPPRRDASPANGSPASWASRLTPNKKHSTDFLVCTLFVLKKTRAKHGAGARMPGYVRS